VVQAVARKDGYAVADWTLQFAEDQTCPDPENFKQDVHAKFKEYLSVRGTASNTGECMTELFDQIRKHRVNMDGDVCTVMVTTLILEVVFSHHSCLPFCSQMHFRISFGDDHTHL
jgi:aarF domain-containing kinase